VEKRVLFGGEAGVHVRRACVAVSKEHGVPADPARLPGGWIQVRMCMFFVGFERRCMRVRVCVAVLKEHGVPANPTRLLGWESVPLCVGV
jgi:hypothetical protein